MSWFNYFGLVIIIILMIPNVLFAIKCKDGFVNSYKNKAVEILEQAGRYGCFALMIFNIPHICLGFWFKGGLTVYLIVNGILCLAYLICWKLFWGKANLARAIWLSVLPSVIFILSGLLIANIPLLVFSLIFAFCHILISCKNAH